MELQEDVFLGEIISRLPLKFVVQCKLLSKNLKRHKNTSTQLIYTRNDGSALRKFHKISLNPITQSKFHKENHHKKKSRQSEKKKKKQEDEEEENKKKCCNRASSGEDVWRIFHSKFALSIKHRHDWIYVSCILTSLLDLWSKPTKLQLLNIPSGILSFINFHWSDEIQLRTNFSFLSFGSPPAYCCDSLYWLSSDTKREEAIFIDRPEYFDHRLT
ncbi:hypothetical protein H5410_017538 [Solanum commersonii]|uniref:Uncharacterized protein n=1 Tax=Solanum commersonii TaxID=4109 RepID=A0A9J6A096_SOLCO|nr:hypothetical protein H5410_017538 [Solanum commersonii]